MTNEVKEFIEKESKKMEGNIYAYNLGYNSACKHITHIIESGAGRDGGRKDIINKIKELQK